MTRWQFLRYAQRVLLSLTGTSPYMLSILRNAKIHYFFFLLHFFFKKLSTKQKKRMISQKKIVSLHISLPRR